MYYKAAWISDVHLGTDGCRAESLVNFLRQNEFDTLYLVGDIIDLWHVRKGRHWPQLHNDVLQKILRKGRKGSRIIYIPGNHDQFCRNFMGVYGNLSFKSKCVHTTASGQRLLIMHGHEFDAVAKHAAWLTYAGDLAYESLLKLNRPLNLMRSWFNLGHWSLSAYAKNRVKNVVSFISNFEEAVSHYAELHRADGIVCGHIHTPSIRQIRKVTYFNCGDWVENCTSLVEHRDGRMELLHQPWDARITLSKTFAVCPDTLLPAPKEVPVSTP